MSDRVWVALILTAIVLIALLATTGHEPTDNGRINTTTTEAGP